MSVAITAATAEVDVGLVAWAVRERAAARFAGVANDNEAFRFEMAGDLNPDITKKWLVNDLLGASEFSCWFGQPGCGKSIMVADLALHVAAGKIWFELPVTQAPALFFAGERRGLMQRRVAGLMRYHGLPKDLPLALASGQLDITSEKNSRLFVDCVHRFEDQAGKPCGLIVVDTLSRALAGANENGTEDMGVAMKNVEMIRSATNAHVLIVHHVGHGADAQSRMRGNSALNGAVDTGVLVTKGIKGGKVKITKENDGPEELEIRFGIESYVTGRDKDGKETSIPIAIAANEPPPIKFNLKAGALTKVQLAVLGVLKSGTEGDATMSLDEWRDAYYDATPDLADGARRQNFWRASKKLSEAGQVEQIDDRFRPTNERDIS
jgi:AAA domain